MIKDKLSATKKVRDSYVASFIGSIQQKLEDASLKFQMKGRTESIRSVWQKTKKQKCSFEGICNLFAIHIILDTPLEREKMRCWQIYSVIMDMYQPNPERPCDWLSVPKSNGYESLHITVLGPENKRVEVQIHIERMDEIVERGLTAYWRYKGIRSQDSINEWLVSIRTALEVSDDLQVMDQFKLDLHEDEVYVLTPEDEIKKFPNGRLLYTFPSPRDRSS